jgi:hypothetical protein
MWTGIGVVLNALGALILGWLKQKDAELAEVKSGRAMEIAKQNQVAAETSDAMAQAAAQHPTDDGVAKRMRDESF